MNIGEMQDIDVDKILKSSDFNIADYMVHRHIREGRGNNIAIEYQDNIISYQSLSNDVQNFSSYLSSRGISYKDMVMVIIDDSPAFSIVFFAIVALGAVPIPINPNQNIEIIEYMADDTGAKNIIIGDRGGRKFQDLRQNIINKLIKVDDYGNIITDSSKIIISEYEGKADTYRTNEHDIAFCLYSSGTTGKPKGIVHRQRDVIFCAKAYAVGVLGMTENDKVFAISKLSFGYSLSGVMLFSFIFGAAIVLLPEQSTAKTVVNVIKKSKPTILLCQPRMASDIIKETTNKSVMDSIRVMVTAGEVLSPSVFKKFKELFDIELLDGFGSTEVGHIFISNLKSQIKENSLGVALEGFELKIIDSNGLEVKDTEIGRLCIKGKSITPYYWNNKEKTEKHLKDGWFYSDDLFYKKEGYFYFVGRTDEMIKTGCGEWISPSEIEKVILDVKSVLDCAVIGFRDDNNVLHLKALVVASDGLDGSLKEDITNSTKKAWPDLTFKHINFIEFVSSLPRSNNGKLLRNSLNSKSLNDFSYDC